MLRRRPPTWVGITAGAVLAVGAVTGGGIGWQAFASEEVATAHRAVWTASSALTRVTDESKSALDDAATTHSSLTGFLGAARPDYLAAATVAALKTASDGLDSATAHLAYTPFVPPEVPLRSIDLLPWTVLSEVQRMHGIATQEDSLGRKRAAELKAVQTAQKRTTGATLAVYQALAAHGEDVLKADDVATYASKITLRHAIDSGSNDSARAADPGAVFAQLMATIDDVNASQAVGEAAKQDPAYPVRAAIEAYARSISNGVTIDFEWHHEVRGLGDDWYSGTTVYHEDDGGWATIDLNFETAVGWKHGDINAKALITHEVGHTQVVRPVCKALFDAPPFTGNDEMWATAWAIGMGFDTAGSGISAYGRPTDEQIAVAAKCR